MAQRGAENLHTLAHGYGRTGGPIGKCGRWCQFPNLKKAVDSYYRYMALRRLTMYVDDIVCLVELASLWSTPVSGPGSLGYLPRCSAHRATPEHPQGGG